MNASFQNNERGELCVHQRFARHIANLDNPNPFPGIVALQRRIGWAIRLRLGGNENLDAPLTGLRDVYGEAFCEQVRLYGDPGCSALRERLAALVGVEPNRLSVDNGADSVIALCLRALCVPGDAVVCTAGTYPSFAYFARGSGCRIVETPYRRTGDHLSVPLDALLDDAIRHRAKVIYVANPDNPTGSWHAMGAIDALVSRLPADCTLLLDEAYLDFCAPLLASRARTWPACIRIRSLSKAYALAGVRIGYALAAPETIEALDKVRIHYAVGGLAQHIALAALADTREAERLVRANEQLREAVDRRFTDAGYAVQQSGTNFISLLLPTAGQAAQLQASLLDRQIAIHRPQHNALSHLIRLTVCKSLCDESLLAYFDPSPASAQ